MYDLFKMALESGTSFSTDLGTHVRRILTPRRLFEHATRQSLRADLIAGLTVAAVIIPNAMAYSLLVGLPPQMGLYATLASAALGVLWGSSAFVITGAVGVVSLLTLTALIPFAPLGSPLFFTLAIALAFIVGGIQLIAGLLRLGYLARLIPHSVLIGFSTAAALIIASTQIPALLGFSVVQKEHVIDTLFQIVAKIPETHFFTFAIGVGSLVFLSLSRRFAPRFPAALLLLLAGIAGSSFFSIGTYGVTLIGDIPARLPALEIPILSFTTVATLVSSAFVIALVGFLETFAIAKSIAKTTRERLSSDKELVGQGIANIGAGLLGGLPVSGSFSASAVNVSAGARTALSAIVVSLAILVALLFLSPLLELLPRVVLAAIVISAVMRLVDIRRIYDAFSFSPSGGTTAVITFALAFLFKPDVAVIAGIFVAFIFLIHSIMFAKVQEVGFDRELSNTLHPVGVRESVETLPKLLIVRIESSILYANSEHIVEGMRETLARHEAMGEPPKLFAMSFAGVNDIDLTGIEDLGVFFRELRSKNIDIGVVYAKKRERNTLRRAYAVVGPITFLHSIDELKARYDTVIRAGRIKV